MKIIVTENQFKNLKKIVEQDNQCEIQDIDVINDFLNGVIELDDNTLGDEVEDSELLGQISNPKNKEVFQKVVSNFNNMNPQELKDELVKILSIKNLKEQDVPYMDQTMIIGGLELPKVVVHALGGILIISILSKLLKSLGSMFRYSRGTKNQRLQSRSVGCQGANARAKLVRKRRRRENWRALMRKLGMR